MTQIKQRYKPWEHYRSGRRTGEKGEPKKRFLIVCEGEKTEPNYFRSFRLPTADVIVEGLGTHTIWIVTKAIELKQKAVDSGMPYDQIWCVFDRDSFSVTDFNNALQKARENSIEVAYSNEAFEVWYLLHFDYFHTGVSRKDYKDKLTRKLGKEYKKNSETMYDELLELQPQAIKFAQKLLQTYNPINPVNDNPSTTIFRLVEELNKNL